MPSKLYDVVVVGSGAGGGTLSARLAELGADVLVLEGGPKLDTRTDFNTHALPYEFPFRHIPVMKPGKPGMDGERSRGLGGKTQLWNAVALRFSQRDFKGRQHDGAGQDWPFGYADIKPFYDRIEKQVGVCGNYDHLEDLPDGIFMPPAPFKCTDLAIQAGAKKLNVPVIHVRKATLTRPTAHRPACHYCGNCMSGCDVAAKYNSYDAHMIPALQTGHLTLQQNSIVHELAVSDEARVQEVRYFDRETRAPSVAKGRVVVVSCACAQSVALLLMSKSKRFPTGLANSSGELGKNFIPHITAGFEAFLTDFIGKPSVNDEGFLDHAYIPSFMHDRQRDYARSFGIQFNYQNHRSAGWTRLVKGMGRSYKESIKKRYPAYLTFTGYHEMLPNKDSFIDLDPERVDEYGLPRARRTWKLSDSDWKLHNDMKAWCKNILLSSNAEILSVSAAPATNHEVGGCRIGTDPRNSVVNEFCRAHDVPNLYVVDASVFPSSSEKNPTLTIMALATRTADHIADRLQKREV
ncbi:MAG TPA: GMC family oxidoreductase [Bryobacteraceae bacterium]|jgi:choline dehydrogenase-like flavoprotein|nr:GMC family oxidoreductase [Bryobacteraceae bacterium]